jgi:hypothetical protein
MKDEGRPFGTTIQVGVSNHLMVQLSKVIVLSNKEKTKHKILSGVYYGDE